MVDTRPPAMFHPSDGRPAPAAAPLFLLAAPVVAVLIAVSATVGGMMVVPLGDWTSVAVLLACLAARRWDGAHTRLLDAAAVLAGIMTIEWVLGNGILLYALMTVSRVQPLQEVVSSLGFVWLLYLGEQFVLLSLFGVACARSRSGILRLGQARGEPDLADG